MMTNLLSAHAATWWIVTGIGLATVGCTTTPPSKDARLDDAPLDCVPDTSVFRLVSVDPSARVANRLDVDGNGSPDDILGQAHDAIAGFDRQFAVAPRFAARLANDLPWLLSIDRCGDEARVMIEEGVRIDGGAPFMPRAQPRAVGTLRDGGLDARDGVARIPVIALGDALGAAPDPGWTDADGLIVRATVSDTGYYQTIAGVFAAALDTDATRDQLAPPIAAFLTAQPTDDALRVGADTDHDGTVTAAELAATTTFQSLIQADVVVHAPDGTPRSELPTSSLAFAFAGVRIR
jgi:hypothetical protein